MKTFLQRFGALVLGCLCGQPADLSRLYPGWVRYAYATLKSGSLLRYVDYRVRKDDTPCQGVPSGDQQLFGRRVQL